MRILVKKKEKKKNCNVNHYFATRVNTMMVALILSLFFEIRVLEKFSEKPLSSEVLQEFHGIWAYI